MNEGAERYEASFYDRGDYEPDIDPRDLDDEEAYERTRSLYRCVDRMCGASDCSNCHPEGFDADPEEEPSDE